jgi:RimJ/RimL family protein N-acetyltransferase
MLGQLNSKRLRLRDATPDDAEALFALDQDPEVMHFLGGLIPGDSLQRKRALLEQRVASYATRPGLGLGACFLNDSAEFIGWFMLRPREYREYDARGALLEAVEHAELGYRLARRFWGQGYATEMSCALVRYGFLQLGLPQIVGFVSPEHRASIRVLEKAGLQRVGRANYGDEDLDLYRCWNDRGHAVK